MDEYEDTPKEPGSSKPWLDAIQEAEKAFATYHDKCDGIDKLYADLKDMAEGKADRELQIFWANLEVLRPSIYQRAPRPVVMPRHSDTGEVVRVASEMIERVLSFDVEHDDLHEVLQLVRDDLTVNGRGVPWVLDNGSAIHVDRRDFLHEPARKWSEVGWVARRAYLSRAAGVERFGDIFHSAKMAAQQRDGNDQNNDYLPSDKKAQVWEIWSKTENKVVWVTEGVEQVLDEQPPLFDVDRFFPCPKPAYSTVQRGTLLPVPDFVYYRDQVDEINELTARMSALAESLRLKGFYAGGASEVGEAVETAIRSTKDKAILVPVSNFAAIGGTALKDAIVWLPVREVAEVIQNLVLLRKQLIEDVYEVTGLSDIMRGVSDANETLGAQSLKAQYGSIRIRERQAEMVRVAADVLRIKAEIFAETYPIEALMQMSGMQFADESTAPPEIIDQLLKSQRLRPFLLEVETDSTIAADEKAEKENRIEFIQAVGGFIQQAGQMVVEQPETAPFAGKLIKFVAGGFRAGRDLGGAVDEFVEVIEQRASQAQQGPTPEQQMAQMESQRAAQKEQSEANVKMQELQIKAQEVRAKAQAEAKKLALEERKLGIEAHKAGLEAAEGFVPAGQAGQVLTAELATQVAQLAQMIEAGNKAIAQLVQAGNQGVIDAVTAPKEIIRDENGRPQGVRTIQ